MKHEAAGDQEAGNAALRHPEGWLSDGDGRPLSSGRPSRRHRLKRSVEVFPASDGSIHLIQEGLGRHFRVDEPGPEDRAVLELLQRRALSADELAAELEARGLSPDTLETSLSELEGIALLEISTGGETPLSPERSERFDRQLIYLSDIGASGASSEEIQARLAEAEVVILGCGGLGSWAACGLACAGVGHLRLIDDDTVELSNLNRQLLFGEPDLGRPKVEAAAEALRRNDGQIEIATHQRRVRSWTEIAELIDGADFLVATADWPPHELARWVNRASLETGVPYISAGQFPPTIRVGPLVVPGRTACLDCQETAIEGDYPLYDELARFRAEAESTASTLGAASGMIGSIISMEAIHLLTGEIDPASLDRALIMDLRTMSMDHEQVERRPDCACASKARAA
ncbi:MAG: HesA/MoeB/ThiF family protein [Solirubrobacterales bacterium]|nr:HesA/MoeB/ThiF family protein [Solirubrobacterales bacterium]